jgi:hypothetical protein
MVMKVWYLLDVKGYAYHFRSVTLYPSPVMKVRTENFTSYSTTWKSPWTQRRPSRGQPAYCSLVPFVRVRSPFRCVRADSLSLWPREGVPLDSQLPGLLREGTHTANQPFGTITEELGLTYFAEKRQQVKEYDWVKNKLMNILKFSSLRQNQMLNRWQDLV